MNRRSNGFDFDIDKFADQLEELASRLRERDVSLNEVNSETLVENDDLTLFELSFKYHAARGSENLNTLPFQSSASDCAELFVELAEERDMDPRDVELRDNDYLKGSVFSSVDDERVMIEIPLDESAYRTAEQRIELMLDFYNGNTELTDD